VVPVPMPPSDSQMDLLRITLLTSIFQQLYATAKEKKLFLMEAVWTRFFPISVQIRKLIQDGELGDIHRVIADNSFCQDVENTWGANGAKSRMVNMDLAGGALLDRKHHPLLLHNHHQGPH